MAFGLGGLLGIGAKGIGSMLGSEFGQNVIGGIMGNQKIQQGIGQQNKVISGLGDEDKIRGVWDQSQGIVGKMTNFGQYSGAAMDLASQKKYSPNEIIQRRTFVYNEIKEIIMLKIVRSISSTSSKLNIQTFIINSNRTYNTLGCKVL